MKSATTTGLRYWMQRVLKECDRVATDFRADPVHDLRVSLRRCRSIADGMMAMDPDADWKAMKKAGKLLFRRLGELRDVQIMMEWIEKLHPLPAEPTGPNVPQALATASAPPEPGLESKETPPQNANPTAGQTPSHPQVEQSQMARDPAAQALLGILRARESEQKREARAALEEFDRKQWRHWSETLPQRAARIRPGSIVFKHLALERWTTARELHTRAMRTRSQVALHTLRIGIKRFRYIVESFLPAEHRAWSNDLKHMQDLLGEVHDLDVLWATAVSCRIFPNQNSREAWRQHIVEERAKRIDEYRQKMIGADSLWNVWRATLPQGKDIQQIATRRMKLWAKVLDPDFAHSERVARLALELYDALSKVRLLGPAAESPHGNGAGPRASLYAAALLHDVGKSKGNKGHHKSSGELIQAHGTPLGWTTEAMRRAAVVARFHAGALPLRSHKTLRDLLPNEQKIIAYLAAILRLANAFDAEHNGHIRRVHLELPPPVASSTPASSLNSRPRRTNGFLRKPPTLGKDKPLIIAADGYLPSSPTAQTIAAERYLLETVLRRPVIVRQPGAPAG